MSKIHSNVHTLEEARRALQSIGDHLNTTAYVLGPAVTTINNFPQWSTADRVLKDGLALTTTLGDPGVDTLLASEKAIRTAITAATHPRQHSLTSTLDHTSAVAADTIFRADANGLPVASGAIDNGTSFTFSHLLTPAANDGAALGTGALGFSDLFLAAGGVVSWSNGDITLTHAAGQLDLAGGDFNFNLGAIDRVLIDGYTVPHEGFSPLHVMTQTAYDIYGIESTFLATHVLGITQINGYFYTRDFTVKTAGDQRLVGIRSDVWHLAADTNADSCYVVGIEAAGQRTGSTDVGTSWAIGGYFIGINDGAGTSVACGVYATAAGADTNYSIYSALGNVKIDAGGILYVDHIAESAAAHTITLDNLTTAAIGIVPDANDGAYLGTGTLGFSDLFLASGGVINWSNGNVTITHAANDLTFAGGDFQFLLDEYDQFIVDGRTTPHIDDQGLVYVKETSAYDAKAMNVSVWGTSSTGRMLNAIVGDVTDTTAKTADNHYMTGVAGTAWKRGADTNPDITVVTGVLGDARRTGSGDAGDCVITGGEFYALGEAAGTTVAYGIWAGASGADINWAAYFQGDVTVNCGDLYIDGLIEGGYGSLFFRRIDLTVTTGDLLGAVEFQSIGTPTGGTYTSAAAIRCIATEDFNDADDAGTKLSFYTNPIGTEACAETMALNGARLCVDHIGELTGAATITLDNDVTASGNITLAAGKALDCYTNAGYLKPRRVSQSATPTPDVGEVLIHHDSDDGAVMFIYEDPDEGTCLIGPSRGYFPSGW
ncbi:MAG: hypothetical protein ABIL09_07975 [Gemmatimonadota bacterium]